MSKDLKNILSHLNKDVEQEKLLQYLNDHLSDEEKHEIEKQMVDDEFMGDAMEGLQHIQPASIPAAIQKLNSGLSAQLQKNKKRKREPIFTNQGWLYFTIVLLLMLAVVSFFMIRRLAG